MINTAQKMKFSITDFFSKLRIWSYLLKKSLLENFIFLCSKNYDSAYTVFSWDQGIFMINENILHVKDKRISLNAHYQVFFVLQMLMYYEGRVYLPFLHQIY